VKLMPFGRRQNDLIRTTQWILSQINRPKEKNYNCCNNNERNQKKREQNSKVSLIEKAKAIAATTKMTLVRICMLSCWIAAVVMAAAAAPLDLVAVTKGGGDDNGSGNPAASASDVLRDMVFLSGDATDDLGSGGAGRMWSRFIKSNGKSTDQQKGEKESDSEFPRLAAMNGQTSKVVTVSHNRHKWNDWKGEAVAKIISPNDGADDPYDAYEIKDAGTGNPVAVALLNNGLVAMIYEGRNAIVLYRIKNDSLVESKPVSQLSVGGMKQLKTMTHDAKTSTLFVGGNMSSGKRGVVRVDMDGATPKVAWVSEINTKKGAPQLLLRRNGAGSAATEVLLLSRSFYARVGASNGKVLHLKVKDMDWLPEGDSAQAAYDPTHDVIYSTAKTIVRQHDVLTGEALWDHEFYKNSKDLKNINPATDRKDYPPDCSEGKWNGINPNRDEKCSKEGKCPPYFGPGAIFGGPYEKRTLKCNDKYVCCIDGDCCIDETDFFVNWGKSWETGIPSPTSRSIHVTKDGKVHVELHFRGNVDDEESYYESWLATFSADGDGNGKPPSTSSECESQSSKSKCRAAVTSTGCRWKSSAKKCVKAKKCKHIKKSKEACLGATEYDCVYVKNSASKYICKDKK